MKKKSGIAHIVLTVGIILAGVAMLILSGCSSVLNNATEVTEVSEETREETKIEANTRKNGSWNLKDIYETEDDFYKAQEEIKNKLSKIQEYKGHLAESADNLYNCYKCYEEALELYRKFYAYGMLSYDLNMADSKNIKLYKTVENLGVEFEKQVSFMASEITKIENKIILSFIDKDERLQRYKRELEEIMKDKEHVLSEKEEELLANYSEVLDASEDVYNVLTNTELKFGKIKCADGEEVEMTEDNYTTFLKDKDERVRKDAFDSMYKKYSEFSNTMGELYLTRVKEATITSRLRNYDSSLAYAVDNDDATINVYNALIEAVHKDINVNHDFMKVKKELLDKKEMHLYDVYVNPIEAEDDDISFQDASNQVLEALSILGPEYIAKLKEAFDNNWIDVDEKENKMSGAYSEGVYGVHPYVLMNFEYKKSDVSTIAHELGHAMHSYYSSSEQNVIDADYTFMVAEIASTVNELLLAKYQIDNEPDVTKRNELIYELLETYRITFFRQAMFAEFEKTVHSKIEAGEMLTPEDLNNIFYNLNKEYFGEDVVIDDGIKYEWARIPHFYTPFYVYKYSTGISAAVVIANNILEQKEGYVDKYIDMLKQGCTKDSVELLKMVDVDLEDIKTYENSIQFMKDLINQLENNIKGG